MSRLVKVKIHLAPGARLPERATPGSAGYDISALISPDTYFEIPPGERMLVPTGLYFEIPPGYFITLRPRSGLALRSGLTLLNSPATIDSDYRGELQVIIINHGQHSNRINNGDRIAQLLLEKCEEISWEKVGELNLLEDSERGTGGFGSSGGSSMLV